MVSIIRQADRMVTQNYWLNSRHSFSFGPHYDPKNTHHGLLLVSNDDLVRASSGFQTHPHKDMEIVTWVLEGELEHKDTLGNKGVIYPGLAQRMSAGRGIWHSEINPSDKNQVHFVQMWVVPDTESIEPSYQQVDVNSQLRKGGLIPIASGRGYDSAITIRQRHATLWAGRLMAGESLRLPDVKFVHLFVATGSATLENEGTLAAGDAVRLVAAGPRHLSAGSRAGCETLIWDMDAELGDGNSA